MQVIHTGTENPNVNQFIGYKAIKKGIKHNNFNEYVVVVFIIVIVIVITI